ncbi:MAG: PKD domain-containing protein [Bacteroidales bacterium]|jgi:hypothetical protein
MRHTLIIILLFVLMPLHAANYYVATNGSNSSGNGSSSNPWASVSYALSVEGVNASGNLIYVANGTYSESSRWAPAVGLSIRGESETGTIINFTYRATGGSDAAIYYYSSSLTNGNQSLSNMTITGSNLTATKAIWVGYRQNVELHHLTIKDFAAAGVHFRNQVNWMTPPTTYASGNSIHDCIINNCADRFYEERGFSSGTGNLRIDGQQDMHIYNVTFQNNSRPASDNGNSFNVSFCRNTRFSNCTFIRRDNEDYEWNMFAEIFHLRGKFEVDHCTFIGAACLDFSNAIDGSSTRGNYDYCISVHDNTFETASGSQIAKSSVGHTQAAITIEKGIWEYCYIYRNHIKNYPIGISICTPTDYDADYKHFYIHSNLLENIGFSDYQYTWGIAFLLENNGSRTVTLDNMHIWNNTIIGGTSSNFDAIRWVANGTATNSSIKNNIISQWNNRAINIVRQANESASFTNFDVTHNCLHNNGSNIVFMASDISRTNVNLSTGNILSNPLLTSTYRLGDSSPAIAAGINVGLTGTDLDGITWANPPSMGAFEGTIPPSPPDTPEIPVNALFVSTKGNDSSGDGSITYPWATLSYAFSRASAGDTVCMMPGTYTISQQVTWPNSVSLMGLYHPDSVRIESTYSATDQPLIKGETWRGWLYPQTAGHQSISNITFDGNLTTWIAIHVNFRNYVEIHDCKFIDFFHRGVVFYGQASSEFGGINPYYSSKSMPSGWCVGNKIYDCSFTNCARNRGVSPYNGYGNLNVGQQDGIEIYNITIVQNQREAGYNGYGIKFYEGGWNKNMKIHDCDITTDHNRPRGCWNFSIEMWNDLGGCQYYNNRLRGQVDLTNAVLTTGYSYSSWYYNNVIGWDDILNHTEAGITIEGYIENVIISGNIIKNISNAIMMQQIYPNDDWPINNHMEEIQIHDNLIYGLGITEGGWTYGGIVGIAFTEENSNNTGKNCYIYNNTIVSATTNVRNDIYRTVGINYNCLTNWDVLYIKNNILVNFNGGYQDAAPILGVGYSTMRNFEITNNLFYSCGNNNIPKYINGFNTGSGYVYSNNLISNPLFVSTSDFHLQSTSPAIGFGINVGLSTDHDNYNWKIPPSIGCYEYYASTPPRTQHTYYVKNGGNDNMDGKSDATAWATIAKVNAVSLSPGDTVLFRRGDTWREQTSLIPQSGNSSGHIVYGAYGSGNKPRILGSKRENSTNDWINVGTNLWRNTDPYFVNSQGGVGNLIFNNEAIIGHKVYNSSDLNAQGKFYYNLTNQHLTLYSTSNPANYYTNIECALGKDAVRLWNSQDNVIIENLDFRYWGAHGISAGGGNSNIIIRNCHFRYIGGGDHDGGSYGNAVQFWASHSDVLIERNTFYQIYDAAITPQYSGSAAVNISNFVARLNIVEKAYWSFEYFCSTSTASVINGIYFQNNTCVDAGNSWSNAQRPLDQNEGRHLQLWSYDTDVTLSNFYIRNNIFSKATETAIRVGQSLAPRITLDYNLYNVDVLAYDWYTYTTLAVWQAKYNKDAHSLSGNPLFVSNSDFHLQSVSPAIAAGLSVGYVYDYDGKYFSTVPSMGAFEYEESQVLAPVAAFAANRTSINEGQSIQFTDQSTNNPTSWSWNFGDGSTSTSRNPLHTYLTEGIYSVSLTVSNTTGSDNEIKIDYITVTKPIRYLWAKKGGKGLMKNGKRYMIRQIQ